MNEDTGLVRTSVAYPLAGDGARSRLLMGAGLQFLGGVGVAVAAALVLMELVDPVLSALVVVGVALLGYVPLLGYASRTIRSLLADEAEPPAVADWPALLRDGRRMAVVVGLYAVPAVALATIAIALGGVGSSATRASLGAAALAGLLALAALYVLPAALAVVVERGEPSAAWDRGTLGDAVRSGDYLKAWLFGAVVTAVGGAVGTPLSIVLVGLPLLFATQLSVVHATTYGVVRSLGWTLEEPPAPPASGYIPEWDEDGGRKELSEGHLGGSLLPTTPGSDEDDGAGAEETPPSPGSLATTSDDEPSVDGSVDPDAGAPDGDTGEARAGTITPFVEGDGDIERADEEE
jgi:hypothetical protein